MAEQLDSLSLSQVAAFRLGRHHLAEQGRRDAASISRQVGGIQAQVLSAAEISLWARAHQLSRADIHSALWEKRTLVKTTSMRGTLHLLPADEFPLYICALRKCRLRQMRQVMARYGVSRRVADAVTEAVLEALSDGPLTRPQLTEIILSLGLATKKARAWFEQSWWGVMRQALTEGLVCYGPDRGRQVTLVRVDQWLPDYSEPPLEKAQSALLRRYLSAYGPANDRDYSKWSGLSVKEARAARQLLAGELSEVRFGGQRGWILRRDREQLSRSTLDGAAPRLLPHFDCFLLGHADKAQLLDPLHYKRVFRKAGWVSPVVLQQGRVAGIWSHTRRANKVILEIESLQRFSKAVRSGIESEAAALGKFLEAPCQVRFV